MKITDKERQRILELHLKTQMKPWLFGELNEQLLPSITPKTTIPPNNYSWSAGDKYTPKTNLGTGNDEYTIKYTMPNTMTPEDQDYLIQQKEQFNETMEIVRNVLGWVSFFTGFIPHPIGQGISYAADTARALTYLAEGDEYTSGLEMLIVLTDIGIDVGMNKFTKYLKHSQATGELKKLGENINKWDKKYNPTDLFTKGDMKVMDEIANSKTMEKIYNGFDEYQKDVIGEYLKNPSNFKDGMNWKKYLERGNKQLNMSKLEFERFKTRYWNDWRRRKLTPILHFLSQGLMHYLADTVWRATYSSIIEQPLKNRPDFEVIMRYFGGDVNNSDDVNKLEKAWTDPRIDHIIGDDNQRQKGFRSEVKNEDGLYSIYPYPNLTEYGADDGGYLPCDLIPSQLSLDEDHPCVRKGFWKMITKAELKGKKLDLPYVYKKIGNDYYYADPKILDPEKSSGTWYKVTDRKSKDFLEKQIFPQFK